MLYSWVKSATSSVIMISFVLFEVPVSNRTVQDKARVWCSQKINVLAANTNTTMALFMWILAVQHDPQSKRKAMIRKSVSP